ncbi:MAG: 23S rRNA (pseudouridine(1915)-N(3))-methyltransferase RlmH [Candidatus Izemoplasmatales bacterium]|nr:23S rRNA (pseudouridine(1915)-N(3))-methyltransferase RlmH [Candidatus Izemoplasmatales bacterium]
MMRILLLSVGTLKESYWKNGLSEYAKRISAYAKWDEISVNESKLPDRPHASDIQRALEEEGTRLISKIPDGSEVITLEIEGSSMSSETFATWLNQKMTYGASTFVFIIGGSHGLSDALKQKSNLSLSFSKMTFPHQMMRLIVAEQIYRALSILHGSSYHK